MGLRLFFLPNFSRAIFIQGATFIPDSRVVGVVSFAETTMYYVLPTNFLKL